MASSLYDTLGAFHDPGVRYALPFVDGTSTVFLAFNRNKRSVAHSGEPTAEQNRYDSRADP